MNDDIPSIERLKDTLQRLGHAQIQELARRSGVPFTTLWKIRSGETKNPGIETVRLWWPLVDAVLAAA